MLYILSVIDLQKCTVLHYFRKFTLKNLRTLIYFIKLNCTCYSDDFKILSDETGPVAKSLYLDQRQFCKWKTLLVILELAGHVQTLPLGKHSDKH